LRIIAGRQEPVVGGRRDRRMTIVKAYLLAHPAGATYEGIAHAVGLSINAACYAVGDIKRFDPDLIVAVPTQHSGWRASIRWRDIMHGEVNQAQHLKTRLETQANNLRKMARSNKFPTHIAAIFMAAAAQSEAQAVQQEALVATYNAAKPHATTGTSGP
jgi:hypothetical protein